ncbi:hypothetical protein ACFYUJ_34510 [Streptomyces sp. NPDC004520]|uniref:hypothetical protein n=1 Tax=Streptomyces sp. NPDC004520 TaxID=3364702 RepID=UPI0036C4C5BD
MGGALLSAATTPVLLRIPRRGRDPRTAAHRACCPAVPVEAVDDAHADVLAVLLPAAAVLAAPYVPYILLSRSSVLGHPGGCADG